MCRTIFFNAHMDELMQGGMVLTGYYSGEMPDTPALSTNGKKRAKNAEKIHALLEEGVVFDTHVSFGLVMEPPTIINDNWKFWSQLRMKYWLSKCVVLDGLARLMALGKMKGETEFSFSFAFAPSVNDLYRRCVLLDVNGTNTLEERTGDFLSRICPEYAGQERELLERGMDRTGITKRLTGSAREYLFRKKILSKEITLL